MAHRRVVLHVRDQGKVERTVLYSRWCRRGAERRKKRGGILLWRGHRRAFTFWLINGQLLGLPTSTLRCLSREFRDPFVRSSLFKPRGKKSWLDDAALGEARVYEVVRSM